MEISDGLKNLTQMLFSLLKEKHLSLVSCESLTGGMFGFVICSIPGASNYYKGGFITYNNEVKEMVGVSKETLDKYTAISKETACEMAKTSKEKLKADIGISFTGNAGPTMQDGKDKGEVWIGVAYLDQVEAIKFMFDGERNQIREDSVKEGLKLLLTILSE